jgi:predicted ATPase
MLTRLDIQNFKTFGERVTFELRPLTILLGANGSGKTSVLDAAGLLAQSGPATEQKVQLKWGDRLSDAGLGGTNSFHNLDPTLEFWIAVEIEAGEHYAHWLRLQHEIAETEVQRLGYGIGSRPATDEWRHELSVDRKIVASNHTMRLGRSAKTRGHGSLLECDFSTPSERVFEPAASGDAALNPRLFIGTRAVGGKEVDEPSHARFMRFGLYTSFIAAYLRQRLFMIGPSRVPKRETPEIDAGPLAVGRRGERTITVLSVIFSRARHSEQARKIQSWAELFGMKFLTAGWVREEFLHAGCLDPTFETPLSIESAGAGAQQILPVITQIFSAPKSSVLAIEEPEAGLHPEGRVLAAKMLADAVNHGHQLLLSTHSSTILETLNQLADERTLNPDDIAVYRLVKTPAGVNVARIALEEAANARKPVASLAKVAQFS